MASEEIIFDKVKEKDLYKKDNARKVNSAKKPNGYLYIVHSKRFDLIKIGVSSSPKRRINDIKSYLPFTVNCIFLKYYQAVYSLEQIIHDRFKNNQIKGEWFQVYKEDVIELKNILNDME